MRVVLFHVLIFLLVFFIFFDTKKLFPAELKKYRFFTAVLTLPQRAELFSSRKGYYAGLPDFARNRARRTPCKIRIKIQFLRYAVFKFILTLNIR